MSHASCLKMVALFTYLVNIFAQLFCRIGTIKQLVCVYSEAIEEFRKLLADQGDYVPALKGKSSTYSRVPNKRGGGENNRGGWKRFDIATIGGVGVIGGGGCLEK